MSDNPTSEIDRYKKLLEISRDLASTVELDALLNRIIFAAQEITNSEAASILLYDPIEKKLFFQNATNMDPRLQGISVPMDSIAGWILQHRKTVMLDDVSKDERHFDSVAKKVEVNTRSLIGVPLISKGEVIGVLEVINKKTGHYDLTDEESMVVLGAQAAVAIENSRLFYQSDHIYEFVHELRTPLAAISTATYLLMRSEISKEQSEKIIKNINSETKRLSELASSFLDLARLQSGRTRYQKKNIEVGSMVDECIAILQPKAIEDGITISRSVQVGIPEIIADRDKLKQVLINLISNAIKYNKTNGTVKVDVTFTKSLCTFVVTDDGFGIPSSAIPNLFKKFYRVSGIEGKVTGTGLGLAISKEIIQGHGGNIEIDSKENIGTKISFNIPFIASDIRA
jgi:signal transduction histidine kinase